MAAKKTARTRYNKEDPLVEAKVRVLSVWWTTLEPSPLQEGTFVEVEHRAQKGDEIKIPESFYKMHMESSNAFFRDEELVEGEGEGGEELTALSQMSEAELINWHRATKPTAKEIVEAVGNDQDLARRMLVAEEAGTNGKSRETVVGALAEVIARA